MKRTPQNQAPDDADARRAIKPVTVYTVETLPAPDMATYTAARKTVELADELIVPPREAKTFRVPAGNFFRKRHSRSCYQAFWDTPFQRFAAVTN